MKKWTLNDGIFDYRWVLPPIIHPACACAPNRRPRLYIRAPLDGDPESVCLRGTERAVVFFLFFYIRRRYTFCADAG